MDKAKITEEFEFLKANVEHFLPGAKEQVRASLDRLRFLVGVDELPTEENQTEQS